jgi:hypothetical protein
MLWQSKNPPLKILEMTSQDNNWEENAKVGSFVSILQKLDSMHEDDLVHGDIRLSNLLSSGYIVDFDFAGRDFYPEGLNKLGDDGKRHPDVIRAINAVVVHEMQPQKQHDWYSMSTVMELFTPATETNNEWWQQAISYVNNGQLEEAVELLQGHKEISLSMNR